MPEQAVDLDAVLGEEPATSAWMRLLGQLTTRLVESVLEGELSDHLGYDRHDAAARDGGNRRNGHRVKTVSADIHEAISAWVSCAFWPARKTSTRGPA
jgi:transposase-like protein